MSIFSFQFYLSVRNFRRHIWHTNYEKQTCTMKEQQLSNEIELKRVFSNELTFPGEPLEVYYGEGNERRKPARRFWLIGTRNILTDMKATLISALVLQFASQFQKHLEV